MDSHAYPGQGLSLSQLVFALNKELKHTAYSPFFTFDDVSQIDRDVSTALANIREWRNSFVPINRVPLDILPLVPTYLSSQKDRFRASFVCRHWRRTFLQHAPLWSQLRLSKGSACTKTLLERAKGSALDIITKSSNPAAAVALLPPHSQQIRCIDFEWGHWEDVQRFSEVNPGPLPLLHTLKISVFNQFSLDGWPDVMTPPLLPLFISAVNLRTFVLYSERFPFLNYFVFPNLTTFQLSATPGGEGYRISELLDFLEASPALRTVQMKITADLMLEGLPQERVVVLPNVETFSLIVNDYDGPGFAIATHISCPSARHTSINHEKFTDDMIPEEIFPFPVSWNAIIRQYTRSPVESVEFGTHMDRDPSFTCSLVFRSSDASVLQLGFNVAAGDVDVEPQMSTSQLHDHAFLQAHTTIRDLPSLANVKHLYIHHGIGYGSEITPIENEVGRLFKSLATLDEFTMFDCDLRLYLVPFLDRLRANELEQPFVFPATKKLTISHPRMPSDREECAMIIVELAKSQHALGIPFECVTVRLDRLPESLAGMLRPWVGAADCYDELFLEGP